jgi:hypothetical protein
MDVAADVLRAIDPEGTPPTSVRDSGRPPRAVATDPDGFAGAVVTEARAAAGAVLDAEGAGRVAVLAPGARVAELASDLGVVGGGGADGGVDLETSVVVCEVADAKGLEFDAVVLADPAGIVEESPRGLNDLYVALTRATRTLVVVHPGPLPPVLARLDDSAA